MICTLIVVKVHFIRILVFNRCALRIIVTDLDKTQFMQQNMHKSSHIYQSLMFTRKISSVITQAELRQRPHVYVSLDSNSTKQI